MAGQTTRTDAGVGSSDNSTQAGYVAKVTRVNTNPVTVRTDSGVGSSTQRSESSGTETVA